MPLLARPSRHAKPQHGNRGKFNYAAILSEFDTLDRGQKIGCVAALILMCVLLAIIVLSPLSKTSRDERYWTEHLRVYQSIVAQHPVLRRAKASGFRGLPETVGSRVPMGIVGSAWEHKYHIPGKAVVCDFSGGNLSYSRLTSSLQDDRRASTHLDVDALILVSPIVQIEGPQYMRVDKKGQRVDSSSQRSYVEHREIFVLDIKTGTLTAMLGFSASAPSRTRDVGKHGQHSFQLYRGDSVINAVNKLPLTVYDAKNNRYVARNDGDKTVVYVGTINDVPEAVDGGS